MNKEFSPQFTNDSDLVFASYFAKKEADRWRISSRNILKDQILNREAYVLLIFSSELYLKSLLMILGVNVMEKFKNKDGHNLYKLFKALPDKSLKKEISEKVIFHSKQLKINRKELNTFDDFLKEISNGFINYRYEYETFLKNKVLVIPMEFITNFNFILYLVFENIKYEAIDDLGNVSNIKEPEFICNYINKKSKSTLE